MDVSVTIQHPTTNTLINQLQTNPFPWMQRLNTVSDIFHFNSVSAFNGYPVTHFNKPVTIVLSYNPNKLDGVDPRQLRIALYNLTTHQWTILKNNTVLNISQHTVANTTTNLTYFAVVYPTNRLNNSVKVLGAHAKNTHNKNATAKETKSTNKYKKTSFKGTPRPISYGLKVVKNIIQNFFHSS